VTTAWGGQLEDGEERGSKDEPERDEGTRANENTRARSDDDSNDGPTLVLTRGQRRGSGPAKDATRARRTQRPHRWKDANMRARAGHDQPRRM
jgi:hypothetical protein